jgi:hypothetical protein
VVEAALFFKRGYMSEQVRVMRTESEWAEIMERQRASGLSQPKFCEREGIAQSTFDRWYNRLGAGKQSGRMVQVALPAEKPTPGAVELEFPSGLILRIRG